MSRNAHRFAAAVAALALIATLAACQKEGPAERAGKEVDKTVDKMKDAIKK